MVLATPCLRCAVVDPVPPQVEHLNKQTHQQAAQY
jgi:hypothetical protein